MLNRHPQRSVIFVKVTVFCRYYCTLFATGNQLHGLSDNATLALNVPSFLLPEYFNHPGTVFQLLVHKSWHCMKSVRIWSFPGPYFFAFGLNTKTYGVFFRILSECRKLRTSQTPNTDTFHAVWVNREESCIINSFKKSSKCMDSKLSVVSPVS